MQTSGFDLYPDAPQAVDGNTVTIHDQILQGDATFSIAETDRHLSAWVDEQAQVNFRQVLSPVAVTLDATNIGSSSAQLNGRLGIGTAPSANVNFVWDTHPWSPTTPYTHSTPSQTMEASGPFTYNLTDLSPGTTYYYMAKAVSDFGPTWGIEKSFTTLDNSPPVLGALNLPVEPVIIGSTVSGSASFSDPDATDTHTGEWDWGDGSTSAATIDEASGNGTAAGSYTYTEAGVYEVKLTVTDNHGGTGESTFRYVVVYNPEGGFVTGGGWIDSPAGAYSVDPALTGKATFGFVAKYQKGANIPTGQTEFQFHVANLNFHSESYDWLVVAGAKAQYKGSGTLTIGSTTTDCRFMLTAIDSQLSGGDKGDRFRIKIWDKATGNVIYDNQMGKDENGDFATEIQGGSIVIHK